MKGYKIHYSIQMGVNIEVDAESEEEALDKAEEIFDTIGVEEFDFGDAICEGVVDVTEYREPKRGAWDPSIELAYGACG